MSRTLATQIEDNSYFIAGYDARNRAVHKLESDIPESEIRHQILDQALQISSNLQTTLDVDEVISFFSKDVKSLVAHDGIVYTNELYNVEILAGKITANSCTYRLVIKGASLGELAFYRKKAFSNEELILLEYLLCSLVYPLRNAIMYKQARDASMKDPLTGAMNRSSLDQTVRREIDLARRHGKPLSLMVIDIDKFKKINDTYGHSVGDRVIQGTVNCIQKTIRSSDILFRYGGEEFVVLLNGAAKKGATMLAERIRESIEQGECTAEGNKIKTSVSIGIAILDIDDEPESLFSHADKALYSAKNAGRNCVKVYSTKN
ncbi:MAG: GGDEF domain-containing protein [Gammaproteobacteria bacterium]|nr:GGDEF domain-containing protein [Gammaproteobacteria bacterium]